MPLRLTGWIAMSWREGCPSAYGYDARPSSSVRGDRGGVSWSSKEWLGLSYFEWVLSLSLYGDGTKHFCLQGELCLNQKKRPLWLTGWIAMSWRDSCPAYGMMLGRALRSEGTGGGVSWSSIGRLGLSYLEWEGRSLRKSTAALAVSGAPLSASSIRNFGTRIGSEDWGRQARIQSRCGTALGLGETGWSDSVRFGPDQRQGLPVECLSCAVDRAFVRTDGFGGQLRAYSELAHSCYGYKAQGGVLLIKTKHCDR
ncbi:hypothetical protein AVEN_89535-1 [Araneus ventricosus]|uniref:Uncharacterized protein n=1 Tax=Araneus ventricosus TaxID=182803 RepID=A0A4Y2KME0_ARAVE|nr:hypothetical protein AVEN_89535-1 [Araneus ventricosus]